MSRVSAFLDRHGRDGAALLLRVVPSLFLVVNHGGPKLMKFSEKHTTFSDPLGIGSTASMLGTIGGELVFPLLVAVGLFTRLATLPTIFTMLVAAWIVHSDDRFGKGAPATMFAVCALAVLLLGPGRFSVDAWLHRRRRGGSA